VLARPNTRVTLDMSGIKRLHSDALLLMRAVMKTAARRGNVGGNLPTNPAVTAKIEQSGFFDGFAQPPADLPPPTAMMLSASRKRVYSTIAAQLVRFAMNNSSVSHDVASASSQTLVEAMTNTRAHASGRSLGKRRGRGRRWYAGVYRRQLNEVFERASVSGRE